MRPGIQSVLDSIGAPALVQNARLDRLAFNRIGRPLHSLPARQARCCGLAPRGDGARPYDKQLVEIVGTVSLPKTANPEHMRSNAEVDFVISDDDMAALRRLRDVDYGEHSAFPVYSGK